MITVFVPTNRGTDETIQCEVPVAVPAPPLDVCHVTLVIPPPPVAVPARLMVLPGSVIIEVVGVVMETAMGPVAGIPPELTGGAGGIRLTVTVWVADRSLASKAVTLIVLTPFTRDIADAVQSNGFVNDAVPLYALSVSHWTV